ncbi:flagellar biosynthesis protein FlhF [Thauera aromatica]|uniref:flagellar biosynthesis protein FlhF n=1 Tax=Thauera aromatica TaxID=59405 RepID=UPI000D16566C|nr:flagellar biosynthesis protein FlhF [Thauera aromatica]
MSVKRFVGANSREAMRQVRAALGDDALILSNRQIEQGVEIIAIADHAAAALGARAVNVPPPPAAPAAAGAEGMRAAAAPSARDSAPPSVPPLARPPASAVPAAEHGLQTMSAMSERLLREMQEMRSLLASTRGDRPLRARASTLPLVELLRGAGFSAALAEELAHGEPEELEAGADDARLEWIARSLLARLRRLEDETAFPGSSRVVALVGPTGVGKTTTTAKLAARLVMRHGPGGVALVSTDSFRIGAHEQLRIYSRLLDVPIHALDVGAPVTDVLTGLVDQRLVLIDTVGTSQRDQRVIEQSARLQQAGIAVRLVLLLNAAAQPETLEEVIVRYREAARAAGGTLDDCILTKLDEAGRIGPVLDALMRHDLRLLFVSSGQQVPEDLALADGAALVRQALAHGTASTAPAALAYEPPARWALGILGQGRRVSAILGALRERIGGFRELEAACDLAGLPTTVREARLRPLCEQALERSAPAGMRWMARAPLAGCDWAMPDIGVDGEGHWMAAALLQHHAPAGQLERLRWARERLGTSVHLLPALPDGAAWAWLEDGGHEWSSAVRGSQRVTYGGERHPLAQLRALASPGGEYRVRMRSRPVRMSLSRLAVDAAPGGSRGAPARPACAWFAELRDADSGTALGQRCWITPDVAEAVALPLLAGQLDGESLPRLTRHAWQRLPQLWQVDTGRELRLLLAAGLAAAAASLEAAEGQWAMDLRAELLGLAGGRRRRTATNLLEALLYLAAARDSLRQVAIGALEGEGGGGA